MFISDFIRHLTGPVTYYLLTAKKRSAFFAPQNQTKPKIALAAVNVWRTPSPQPQTIVLEFTDFASESWTKAAKRTPPKGP